MIQPITNTVPECCGIACAQHGQCARYAALEGSDGASPRIATCDDYGTGERPLFVALEPAWSLCQREAKEMQREPTPC